MSRSAGVRVDAASRGAAPAAVPDRAVVPAAIVAPPAGAGRAGAAAAAELTVPGVRP